MPAAAAAAGGYTLLSCLNPSPWYQGSQEEGCGAGCQWWLQQHVLLGFACLGAHTFKCFKLDMPAQLVPAAAAAHWCWVAWLGMLLWGLCLKAGYEMGPCVTADDGGCIDRCCMGVLVDVNLASHA